MNNPNNTSNTSTTPGQPTPAPQANTPARPSRNTRDLIDRLLDFFHAPPSPRPRSVSPSSSASSASTHRSATATATADDTNPPLCAICSRRESKVLFIVCGHRACTSCTKRLWGSMRRLPGRRYDPRPLCFPCPFCRELVARVGDDMAEGEGGGEGVRVVEWVLRVSRRARERERERLEVVGRTAG